MKRRTQLSGFLLAGITLYAVLWEVAGQAQLFGSAWPHFQLCFVLCYRSATKTAAARHRPYTRRGGDWLPDRHGNGHYVGGGDPLYSHTLEKR